jgi:molybdopterin converting factor subunit 1
MKVRVRYFALVAEITGCGEEALELPAGATVADALAAATASHPRLAEAGLPTLAAVNRRHARPDDLLGDGDEVAIFPPVSGG